MALTIYPQMVLVRYVVGSETNEATSGTIVVISLDTENKTIKGTYSFETETHTISFGQFNVTYQ